MLEDYLAIDLEMTGLNPKTDRILEVGAVKVSGKQVTGTFSRLICPERRLEGQVVALTGITDELAAQGGALDDVLEEFLEFAGDLVWVGHNVIFDYKFIRQWEVNRRIQRSCYAVDTLKIARKCLGGLERKSLDYLCEYFGIVRDKRHRALDDAKAAQVLYEILERDFLEKEPELFAKKELQYKVKRQTPATSRQKEYLGVLLKRHRITPEIPLEQMSRSEASRLTDRIIRQYGSQGRQDSSAESSSLERT